jgi:DNA repair protein RecO (recombination protein O)
VPRPDRVFRTPAIILKRRDFGEADRMLTVLTPQHGKIDVLAKGARKITSTKMGHVELFARVDLLINAGRDFGIVSQAEMTDPYQPLREDLTRSAYASFTAELIDRFVEQGDEEPRILFTLLDETLKRIAHESDPRLALIYFEMHLLDIVGYRPEVQQCVVGHEPVEAQDQVFSYADGGAICPLHAPARSHGVTPLPLATLKLLRHVQRSRYADLRTLNISINLADDAERVLLGYITYVLERRLQSVDFIRRLRQP